MKPSHLTTPRTLNECHWTPGYRCVSSRESVVDCIKGYALAVAIGVGMAALLVAWWSS